jgi:hypothetical protein
VSRRVSIFAALILARLWTAERVNPPHSKAYAAG